MGGGLGRTDRRANLSLRPAASEKKMFFQIFHRSRWHGRLQRHRKQRLWHPGLSRPALVHWDHHGHSGQRCGCSQQRWELNRSSFRSKQEAEKLKLSSNIFAATNIIISNPANPDRNTQHIFTSTEQSSMGYQVGVRNINMHISLWYRWKETLPICTRDEPWFLLRKKRVCYSSDG